jgi:hypothetical protein
MLCNRLSSNRFYPAVQQYRFRSELNFGLPQREHFDRFVTASELMWKVAADYLLALERRIAEDKI